MDITAILQNLQKPGEYVPPISLPKLALMAFEAGITPDSHWPDTMRAAWYQKMREVRAYAWSFGYGEGAAYMVQQGQEVSL
jgi:hypothetical protein